jgi:hypothetical protein
MWLDDISSKDDFGFLDVRNNWESHKPFLYISLFLSNPKSRVIEFGSGLGSTEALRGWCSRALRPFTSYDSDRLWAEKTGAQWIEDWETVPVRDCGLLFLDHAPGERRQLDLVKWAGSAELIVCHDTEIGGAGAYGWDFSGFKYQLHLNRTGGGAGASLLSNTIEVNCFSGLQLGKFKFD